jgi:hypothetical protein
MADWHVILALLGLGAPSWIDLRGPAQRLGPHSLLDRALIGGAQPIHGWWAPDALRYIKKGVGAAGTRSKVRRAPKPTPQTLGLRSACAVASGSTTAPPPFYSFPVVGQCRWRPEGRRNLLRHHINSITMDASGSAPTNDGRNPKLLHLCVSLFPFICNRSIACSYVSLSILFVPRPDTLLVDPVFLSPPSISLSFISK